MRTLLSQNDLESLFDDLGMNGVSTKTIAHNCGYSVRTVSDWKRGKYNMPKQVYEELVGLLNKRPQDYCPKYISEKALKQKAGKIGGRARYDMYGPLGTIDDKRKGGFVSYNLRKGQHDIFRRNTILCPARNRNLAEFMGIMIGDGSVNKYQISISCNMVDDAEYVHYVVAMIWSLFGVQPKVTHIKKKSCTVIVVSSVALTDFLHKQGLPMGNKLRSGLHIPEWISSRQSWIRACLRGIFDTDGSIYLEKHTYKDKVYSYPRMSFVSASPQLRDDISALLDSLEIVSKKRMGRSVVIERFTDIEKYFKIVGSSNSKHLLRFAEFGGVG